MPVVTGEREMSACSDRRERWMPVVTGERERERCMPALTGEKMMYNVVTGERDVCL